MWRKFIYCSDLHGHHQNKKAVDVLLRFTEDFQPVDRFFGGDLWDLSAIRGGASPAEKDEGIEEDLRAGFKFLDDWLPTIVLAGNHCARLWDKRVGEGIIADVCNRAIQQIEEKCEKLGTEFVPYGVKDMVTVGPFSLTHGIAHNMHASKTHAETFPGCTFFGHTHCVDYYRSASYDRREAYNVGCLCDTYPYYAQRRRNTLRWEHGFVYGAWNTETLDYHVQQARPDASGKWRLITDYKEY